MSNDSLDRASLCAFTFRDGRQCRMLRPSADSEYCFDHQRKLRHLHESDQVAAEICAPIAGDFVPSTAVAQSLARVFRAVAEGRIEPQTASALARVGSALLKSLDGATQEFKHCYNDTHWRKQVRKHYNNI
jgi:hypothetical protein